MQVAGRTYLETGDRYGPAYGTPLDTSRIGAFFRRRRWTILVGFVSVMTAVTALTLLLPKTYESTASFLVEQRRAAPSNAPALAVLERLGDEGRLEIVPSLYLAGPEKYLIALREADSCLGCLMVVGHNPGVEELVAVLSGENEPMPTAAGAHIQFSLEAWSDLTWETPGALAACWRPRDIFD